MFDALSEALRSLDGLDALDAVETLEQAGEVQRNINLAQAELLKIACHWADLNAVLHNPHAANLPGTEQLVRLGGAGTPEMAEFASAELGAQLQMSAGGCKMLIADALDLRHRLPLLWALVCLGDVKPYVARQIAQRTRHLGQGPVAVVDQKAARYAKTLPWGRLAAVVDAAAMVADPEQAESDAQDARDRQGVWVGRDTDHGYKKMFIRAAGPDVESFDALVDEVARALDLLGDTDSLDVRRAKAIGIIASTQATQELFALAAAREDEADNAATLPDRASAGRRLERARAIGSAVVYLHLSQEAVSGCFGAGRLEGGGPVTSTQVREFLGHRNVTVKPVVDLNTMRAVDGYEVPGWLDEAVHLVNPADCSPYSSNTQRGVGDIDHNVPYLHPDEGGPPGQTGLPNLGRLLRFHHRWKTHGRWKVIQLVTGVWLWRSPHRFLYLVDGNGTTALGRL